MPRPVEIEVTARCSAPPTAVYAVAKDSAGYPSWSRIGSFEHVRDGKEERYGVGSLRIFRTPPLTLLEEVVELVPDRMVSYTLISGLPFRDYRADIVIEPAASGCLIRWRSRFFPTIWGTHGLCRSFMTAVLADMAPALAKAAASLSADRPTRRETGPSEHEKGRPGEGRPPS